MSSRSWERKVRKNQTQLNKQRKKNGQTPLHVQKSEEKVDTFKGRSFVMPAFLVLFIGMYVITTFTSDYYKDAGAMYWVTIGLYVLMAVIFILRRPYLSVGKDYVRTRRFGGDRNLYTVAIKAISVQKGSVVIEQQKGANWVFSRMINRYPTDEMAERLRAFAAVHNIPFNEKN
ncbi:MFS transporter [Paenibacillus methanolicus]|uniref:PH (Pleckstrin Homology) domain-containing protein n=1 Tax=Paenibacillus methanolicus TaxID=582686 RepID=A0A5S5C3L7_9BACL|nr:MFS transporter [Paenibacillus methanolicus]TYP72553.1 hypothetical protein BCM02_108208 [Paenibacillus methanolicus]